jgi:ABC-type uncharacterized transport system substrate-binding protein
VEIRDPDQLEKAFAALTTARPDAIFVPNDSMFYQHRVQLARLALKSRLPSMWGLRENAEAGGLMAYATNLDDLARRAATFVDKMLKGARAADLPVEQPTNVRAHHQREDREGAPSDDSVVAPAARGSGHRMMTSPLTDFRKGSPP